MIGQESIISEAKKFLASQLGVNPETIQSNASLKSIGLDSFRIIELVLFIERSTGLSFPDHAYTPANLQSVESIASCFSSLQS